MKVPIHFDKDWIQDFTQCINKNNAWAGWGEFKLAIDAARSQTVATFDSLESLKQINTFKPLPHQVDVAKKVIHQMHGRAILADEVGLGKTIEAGLILKEYLIRGLVNKILILVPSSLVLQWTRELFYKFQIPAVAQKGAWMWDRYDIVVGSLDTAKKDPHRSEILNQQYDLVIIDEAHKLKNRATQNWKFINEINKKYCILLTATPVQNEMKDIYNLVTLLKPGQFGQQAAFQYKFSSGKRKVKNKELLHQEIDKVLIRNKRSDNELHLTKRIVETIPITLSPEERALYEGITQFIKGNRDGSQNLLSLVLLQKEVCSSRDAVFHTLFKLFGKNEVSSEVRYIIQLLRNIKMPAKVSEAVNLICDLSPDKVVLFTEYRATQDMILRELAKQNISALPYNGEFKRNKKDYMMELFQKKYQVLVATEAGGEGVNLQFCKHIINFDMPWNPMRVEQRIGRVHRLGQKNDVHIYNFATKDTIEEHIIWLLHEKIGLFENVVGKLETILHKWEQDASLETQILNIIAETSEEEARNKIRNLNQEA